MGLAHDDDDARACGFLSTAAQRQALAIAVSLLPDDAEIRVVPRVRGGIPAPILDRERVVPTTKDRQVLMSMTFEGGKFYTAGNMNRRKFERLEEIGWIKGIGVNVNDVEYYLTKEGEEAYRIRTDAGQARSISTPIVGKSLD